MRIFLTIFIGLVISACTPRLISVPDPTQVPPAIHIQMTPTITSSTDVDAIKSLTVADLSARFSLDPAQVRVLSLDAQLWPDASLGCPRPGESYTQKTVPGYRLVLEANGQEYIYHTDTNQAVILCLEEDLPSFPVTPGEIDDGEPWMPVD